MQPLSNVKAGTARAPRASRAVRVAAKGQLSAGVATASLLSAGVAHAEQLSFSSASFSLPANLPLDDPLVLGGAVGAISVVGLAAVLAATSGPSAKSVTPKQAFEALEKEERAVLIDIRPKALVKEAGSPELKFVTEVPVEAKGTASVKAGTAKGSVKGTAKGTATKTRTVTRPVLATPFTTVDGEEAAPVEGFAEAAAKLPGLSPEALVVLLDGAGAEGAAAGAALLASKEFAPKKVYYVAGGAEAWRAAELPWREPLKLPSLPVALPSVSLPPLPADLSLESLKAAYGESPSSVTLVAAIAAAVGVSAVAINQFETLAQLAGLFAVGQFVLRNVLFADDRQKTVDSVNAFIKNTAADEAASELTKLASTILESATAEIAVQKLTADSDAAPAAAPAAEAAAAEPAAAPEAVSANADYN